MANNNHNIKVLQTALLEKLPSTRVREQELLCHHTTFKIHSLPRTIHELDVPVTIIGCGSNILVKDGGIRGAVVSVRHMTQIMDCNENTLCIGSGYMLKDASEFAWENSLSGLEFAIGIPGTLGGAVFMNAGAYDGEMSHVVTAVRAVDFQGNIKEYDASHLDFAYRHSVFHDNHEVIGEVIMTLKPGDKLVWMS